MSEEILVRHCSPTLANIKTGNLVNCRIDSVYRLKKDIISLNSVLNAKGVSIRVLYCSSERALIYVYRPEKLNADMQNGKNKKFLNSIGYRGTTNDELINELSARVYSCGGFPHEIGLFLGYPIDDVISFIENKGKTLNAADVGKYITMKIMLKRHLKSTKNVLIYTAKNICRVRRLNDLPYKFTKE